MTEQNLGPIMKRRLYTIHDNRSSTETTLNDIEDADIKPNEEDVLITIPTQDDVFSTIYRYFNGEWQFQTQLEWPTIQGDWDQNDTTAPDFIKNKPNFANFEESINELNTKINTIYDLLNTLMIINITGELTDTGFRVIGERHDNSTSFVEIPFVSATKAGIFSSEDYLNLSNILSWNMPGGKFRGFFNKWVDVPNTWSSALWNDNKIYTNDYFIVKDFIGENISSLFIVKNDWKLDAGIGKSSLQPEFNFTHGLKFATEDVAGIVKSSNETLKIKFVNGIGEVNNLPKTPTITYIGDEIDIPISPYPPSEDADNAWYVKLKTGIIYDECIKEICICSEDGEYYGNIYEVK